MPPPPAWSGPPEDELGVGVPIREILYSDPTLAVALIACVAFSNGFEFKIAVRSKVDIPSTEMGFGPPSARGERPEAQLQVAIRFADGRTGGAGAQPDPKLMAYYRAFAEGREPEPVESIVVMVGSSGGGGTHWSFDYWVWPLPPDGALTITCEWPSRIASAVSRELDATAIRAAGANSRKLWNGA